MSHRFHLCWPEPQLPTKFKTHMEGRQGSFFSLPHRKDTYFTKASNPPPFCRRVRVWEWVRLFCRREVAIHAGFVCQLPHMNRQPLLYSSFFSLLQRCHMTSVSLVIFLSFHIFPSTGFPGFFSTLTSISFSTLQSKSTALLFTWKKWVSCGKG